MGPTVAEALNVEWGFCGAKPQGLEVLRVLAAAGYVPRFIAVPEMLPAEERAEFERVAHALGADYFRSRDLSERRAALAGLDLLLVCRFSLLPEAVFTVPSLGAVNIHSSLLPKYRGVHPASWALIDGKSRTGVTIHQIDAGIDTGDVLLQERVKIEDSDDIGSLVVKLNAVSAILAVQLLDKIARTGRLPAARPQRGRASYARRRTPDDGRIDWRGTTRAIHNLLRALTPPLPAAFCHLAGGERIDIMRGDRSPEPGTVVAVTPAGRYVVKTGDGYLIVASAAKLRPGDLLT